LLSEGIRLNPDALDVEALRQQAWQVIEPLYLQRLARLVDNYHVAQSRGLGSDDLAEVALATMAGRVGTLLVEADRDVPGRIDVATGKIQPRHQAQADMGDVLDDLAEAVLRMKGEVVVVPQERMPSSTGIAAAYRF
jgi:hypothetical protein